MMIHRHTIPVFTAALVAGTALVMIAPTADATLLLYDGFAAGGEAPVPSGTYVTSPTNTTGFDNNALVNQGPNLLGFDSADTWTNQDAINSNVYARAIPGGLTYGSLQTTDGAAEVLRPGNTNTTYDKRFSRPTTLTGNTYSTIYASYLLSRNTSGIKAFVSLHQGGNVVQFGINNIDHAYVSQAGYTDATGTEYKDYGATYLLVIRLSSDGSYDFWVNPTDLANEAANTPTRSGTAGTIVYTPDAINEVVISAGTPSSSSTIFDELRIGTEWSDVAAIPEPASIALLAGPALMLIRRRRGA